MCLTSADCPAHQVCPTPGGSCACLPVTCPPGSVQDPATCQCIETPNWPLIGVGVGGILWILAAALHEAATRGGG